jgi:uncharacterized membrane protein
MLSALLHAAFTAGNPVLNVTFETLTLDSIVVFFENGMNLVGGGVIGGLMGMLIMSLVGGIGTIIIAVLLILFCAIFVFGFSLSDVKLKYMKIKEQIAIKNQERAEEEARRAEEIAVATKREELRRAAIEKEEKEEIARKEAGEREIERIRQSTQAHNDRATQIRRELELGKKVAHDFDDEPETDEIPRARKHGDVEEIFQAGLIDDSDEFPEDVLADDDDKEFHGESVDEFWLENGPDSESTFVDVP